MKKLQVVFLFVFLVGCSSNQATSSTATPNIVKTPSPFPTQTAIPPTQTLTPTSTSTPTYTSLPTLTSLPTIEPDMGLQTLYRWLEGAEDCRLPCWAGITPGETNWNEAQQILETMTSFSHVKVLTDEDCIDGKCNLVSWTLTSDLNTHGSWVDGLEEEGNDSLRIQIIDPSLIKALNLQSVLNHYGKPTILLFSTEPDLPGYEFLELILVYPEKQFIMRYSKYAKITSEKVESCGMDSAIELVILDNQDQLTSLDAIAQAVETKNFHVDVWHKSVEEAMGITIDEFYETYSKANAPCISTPTNIWIP